MSQLTKKEIVIFGKVLSSIGSAISDNPEILQKLLKSTKAIGQSKKIEIGDEVKSINIFSFYKQKKKSEIEKHLSEFNKEELKFLIKKHNLGVTRLNSVTTLAEFIADQLAKRSKDVFIDQE